MYSVQPKFTAGGLAGATLQLMLFTGMVDMCIVSNVAGTTRTSLSTKHAVP